LIGRYLTTNEIGAGQRDGDDDEEDHAPGQMPGRVNDQETAECLPENGAQAERHPEPRCGPAALGRREQPGNEREDLGNHDGGACALNESCRDELRSCLA
jgi:hypothetical protein